MASSMTIDQALLQTFREETRERLDRMVDTLLAIEAQGAGPDLIATLFRDAHSIKGNCGMLGFGEPAQIAHAMEDVIQAAEATGSMAGGLIDPMLAATDAIGALVTGATGLAAGVVAALQAQLGDGIGSLSDAAADGAAANDDHAECDQLAENGKSTAAVAAEGATVVRGDGRESSEPAAPAPRSIRVDAGRVDQLLDVVGETVLHQRRLEHLVNQGAMDGTGVEAELGHGQLLIDELQSSVTHMRALPLSSITGNYPRAVRDMAASAGKQVQLRLIGTDTQLDRLILDGISETIVHLVRNCVSHGIEAPAQRVAAGKPELGQLEVRADARAEWVAVTVRDDGQGVSPALMARATETGSLVEVLAQAGTSTAAEVTELSGRGIGLGAVKRHVESLGGTVEVKSVSGHGTAVTLLLPLTSSMVRLLLIESAGQVFGVPLANSIEVVSIAVTLSLAGRESIDVRGEAVPLLNVSEALCGRACEAGRKAVIVARSDRRIALTCDAILDEQEVVVKSLGPLLIGLPGYLGAAILADARIALILDPAFLVHTRARAVRTIAPAQPVRRKSKVMVVDDQLTVRELERSILESAGYGVITAEDGRAAMDMLQRDGEIALVLTDIEMPRLTGLELLAEIRADPERSSLPVVIVTSRGDTEDRRLGAEGGADAYVVKSEFAQEGLLTIVRRLMDL